MAVRAFVMFPSASTPKPSTLLDWFHITMRITVMANMANMAKSKSLHPPPPDPDVGLTAEVATKLINEPR